MVFLQKQKKEEAQETRPFHKLLAEKEEVLIDCLGDSITWGMRSTPEMKQKVAAGEIETSRDDGGQENLGIYVSGIFQSNPTYPEAAGKQLNRKLPEKGITTKVKTVNDGLSGDWITEETYQRMTCDPDLVLLLMGGNNFYFDYPIEGMFEANLDYFQEKGIPVYLVNYALYPGDYHEKDFRSANEWMEKIATEYNLPLIDISSRFEEVIFDGEGEVPEGKFRRDDLFSPDHIHLSDKGYELLGTFVADSLLEEINW